MFEERDLFILPGNYVTKQFLRNQFWTSRKKGVFFENLISSVKKKKEGTFVHQNVKFRESQGKGKEKKKKKTNLGFDDCSKRERPRSVYLPGY